MDTAKAKLSDGVRFRSGQVGDAEVLGNICYEAFKTISEAHNFPPDFPSVEEAVGLISMLISRTDIYSVVAEDGNGKLVGSNFLWESDAVAGIGPVTVDAALQNSTVGRALMNDILRRADEKRFVSVRLVQAAFHSRSLALYTKFGFATVEPLSNIQGAPLGLKIEGYDIRKMTVADLESVDALAFRVHGHTRHNEVAGAIEQGSATVVEHGGRITGYTTGVGFFGHSVGETNRDLQALIGAAEAFPGPGFLLPTRNGELMRWCLDHGLKIIQPLTLMSRGIYQEPRGGFLPSILF